MERGKVGEGKGKGRRGKGEIYIGIGCFADSNESDF